MKKRRFNRLEKLTFYSVLAGVAVFVATLLTVPEIRAKLGWGEPEAQIQVQTEAQPQVTDLPASSTTIRHVDVEVSGANSIVTLSAGQNPKMQDRYVIDSLNGTSIITLVPGTSVSLHMSGANNLVTVSKKLTLDVPNGSGSNNHIKQE